MRLVIQRVANASVNVPAEGYEARIGKGLLVLAAFIDEDTDEDLEWCARKLAAMRIFDDADGVMNLSVKDVDGEILAVSQFTLYASTVKGNRPSYIKAAKPDVAVPLYEKFLEKIEEYAGRKPARGVFGADMKVSLLNDGPVTIIVDSKLKF
jgi:D-tyrosyl-tRNA(Tyr) deacylase